MEITFIGAAQHVTGSCTMINCGGHTVLVDCGMPQGSEGKDMKGLLFRANQVDAVILTHAHIDHSGWLPLLVKEGFKGKIWSTAATADLCEIMLADSGHIQEMEAEWKSRKNKRMGLAPVDPVYTAEEAAKAMTHFRTAEYGETVKLYDGISFRLSDAGHLLGSAFVEMWLEEKGQKRKMVFSGDVGNLDQPLIKDPTPIESADFLLIESTYGDRLHQLPKGAVGHSVPNKVRAQELAEIITRTFQRGGNVVVPAFSVGRTQEILYLLRIIITEKMCPGLSSIPTFVDSPLSTKATSVFAANIEGYFDSEAMELVKKGINPLEFPGLVTITDSADSKLLNERKESCVIISSSGMCEAGRIRHHLKHNLWRPECTVVFTGFQAEGTLGRSILDGARHVTIFGEQIDVNAEIRSLQGISGHADRDSLLDWVKEFKEKPRYVFVNHGEKESALAFAACIHDELGIPSYAPTCLEHFDLLDEASFPKQQHFDRNQLPFVRELAEAVEGLKTQHDAFESVVERLLHAAEKKNLPAKDAVRLKNAVNRLASDLDDLSRKWNSDSQ